MPEAAALPADDRQGVLADGGRLPLARTLRSQAFWEQRPLHSIGRIILLAIVAVLLCIAIGFIIAGGGELTRFDLLALAFYAGLAASAWHPTTGAFVVMVICSVGVLFTRSGGDLLELAIALGLVAITCAPWVIATHVVLLGLLTADLAVNASALTGGGVYGIIGIAAVSFLAGIAFRIVAARESLLVAERARVVRDLEIIGRMAQDRIADELHDGIAHDLTLILFHARALPKQPDDAARQVSLTTIEESAEQALLSVQALLSSMKDTQAEPSATRTVRYDGHVVDVVIALETLLREAGIPTTLRAAKLALALSPEQERVLTETAIEAITNILKHSPNSQSARITLHKHSGEVELTVSNVVSIDPAMRTTATGGRGLMRARQRLTRYNGTLDAGAVADGWSVRAVIPTSGKGAG